jgi:hypothetical protein
VVFAVFLLHVVVRSAEAWRLMKWPDDKSPFWYDLSDERARYDVIEKTSAVVLALLGNGMLVRLGLWHNGENPLTDLFSYTDATLCGTIGAGSYCYQY